MSSKLQDGWVKFLRNSSRQDRAGSVRCPLCNGDVAPELVTFKEHVRADSSSHGVLKNDTDIEEAFRKITLKTTRSPQNGGDRPQARPPRKRPVSGSVADDEQGRVELSPDLADTSQPESKKLRSPPASDIQQRGSSPPTPTSGPGKARTPRAADEFDRGFSPRQRPSRQLFNPDSEPPRPRSGHSGQRKGGQQAQSSRRRQQKGAGTQDSAPAGRNPRPRGVSSPHPATSSFMREPVTKDINLEELVSEVKGIYTGLVMIESKCVEVDSAQSSDTEHRLSADQWRALISLHRTLLHEHHDFMLATQHPNASPALRRLAAKYSMPARMWRHGIHSFLELLRHRLPDSYEQMLNFIYVAYGMISLLYETVPAFEDTWIECLGDLARYRMAIEETDLRDREIWTDVARSWYGLASEKSATTGRLYHHLAILARPNAIQQLYFYVKSLCVPAPFPSARESIMTLFEPLLASTPTKLPAIDAAFVRVHAILFSGKHEEQLGSSIDEFARLLDAHIDATAKSWLETGYQIGISLACCLLGYGAEDNFIMQMVQQRRGANHGGAEGRKAEDAPKPEAEPDARFTQARSFMVKVYGAVATRCGDGDTRTLSFIHSILVFMLDMSQYPKAMEHLEGAFPWQVTATMLNYLLGSCESAPRIGDETFPGPHKNDLPRPLPEDFAMRGLLYTEGYYPESWFRDSVVEADEKMFELPSMTDQRKERILWLGRRLASRERWLTWGEERRRFGVAGATDGGEAVKSVIASDT